MASISEKTSNNVQSEQEESKTGLLGVKKYRSLKLAKREHEKLVSKIMSEMKFGPQDRRMISNIFAYCNLMPRMGSTTIDKNIFVGQLFKTFGLNDAQVLDRMFQVSKGRPKDIELEVTDFARVICIFVSNDIRVKAKFVFRVYNNKHITETQSMSSRDIYFKLRTIVGYVTAESNEGEDEETLREIVDVTVGFFDHNRDGMVDYSEFEQTVIKQPLLLECLGPCLPEPAYLLPFKKKMTEMTETEVLGHYRHERTRCLRYPHIKQENSIQKLYPIELDLPGNM